MSSVALIILVVVVAIAVFVRLAPSRFALEDRPPTLRFTAADGWPLAAHHRAARARRFLEPVVLCHGLANNHAFMEFQPPASLAAALADAGFEVYSLDLRGAGHSTRAEFGPWDATFDDYVELDVPAALEAICRHSGSQRVYWVGHSLGGLVGVAVAAALPKAFAGVVTVGAPVYFRYPHPVEWGLRLGRWLSVGGQFPVDWLGVLGLPLAGLFEARVTGISANLRNMDVGVQRHALANIVAPVWRGVFVQLEDWVRHDAFRSEDGRVDYRANALGLELPMLVLGGSVDYLAPPKVTKAWYEALRSSDKTLRLFGRKSGELEDYGHGDLLLGRAASSEVFPHITTWLTAHATRVDDRRSDVLSEA